MIEHRELTVAPASYSSDSPHVLAVFDLSSAAVCAISDALGWVRRTRLTDTSTADQVLKLREHITLADQVADRVAQIDLADRHLLRATAEQLTALCEAASGYATERDVEGYQPPAERERIAVLRAVSGPLMDLTADVRAAERSLTESAQPAETAAPL